MKKHFIPLFLAAFMLMGNLVCQADNDVSKTFNQVMFKPLPELVVSPCGKEQTAGGKQGVSAAFAGQSNSLVIMAGGCNFPDVPAADGGAKQFYREVRVLDPDKAEGWQTIGQLTKGAAYGVSITTPDGLVAIGGTDGEKSLTDVILLSVDKDGKTLNQKVLPSLPQGLDNMAGAYGGGYIYVAGGQTTGADAKQPQGSQNKAFRLKYPDGKSWEVLPDFPGEPRLQPVASVQNAATGARFFLLGGYAPGQTHRDGLCYDPVANQWTQTAPMTDQLSPSALVGAVCVNSGTSFIVCMGGVKRQIFDQALQRGQLIANASSPNVIDSLKAEQHAYMLHPAEWYQFNTTLLVYNTITNTWSTMAGSPNLARAGATLVDYTVNGQHQWLLVGGETKPGVRGTSVTFASVSYEANFGWLNWVVLIAYLVAMVGLGYFFMRREKSSNDFFTGGGRIPWWAAGISIFATMLSAITYMSIPAKAYATDWKYYPMQILILLVAFPVIKYYLPFFRRLKLSTAYAYLEQRFNYGVRVMASALFIVFMVARMALVLFLPSLAMSAVTGIDIFLCIVLMAVITIIYCTMGGMEAVVWGDVVQGFILVGGALLAAVYLVTQTTGGVTEYVNIAMQDEKFTLFDWSLDYRSATFWVIIVGGLANNLISYTSDQTVIQRYMTTKNEKSASRSIITNGILSILVSIIFYTIGTGLYTFYKTHPASIDITMSKTDAIFPFFMMSQLPAGIAGLLIAALFAATMSTISSNINSISTAFTMDMYKKWRPQTSDKKTLSVARYTGIISGLIGMLIAIVMAMVDIQSLLDYFNTILGLLTGAIGGLFIMGIFFKRINAACALIGFVCGTLAVFWMNFFTDANFFLFGATSIVVSVGVALGLSFIWPNRKDINGLTWKTLKK